MTAKGVARARACCPVAQEINSFTFVYTVRIPNGLGHEDTRLPVRHRWEPVVQPTG